MERIQGVREQEIKMGVVAIVQARMGSGRFPGKVMKEIVAKPILWDVINRLKRSKLVDNATTEEKIDKSILKLAEDLE